ncbi:MAG TPA: alpha/beta fold hydrolase [Polyangiaceae bacterium]
MPRISVDGIELNVRVEGQGEPVVLVHGFPDSSELWRLLTPRLVSAGFRTIALDVRGFGESDAPVGKRHYRLARLADDVLAVMDAFGIEKAHLVGHDWGAATAWFLAGTRPERFHTLTALSLGHARAYLAAGIRQIVRAWYIVLILVPFVAEAVARAWSWALFRAGSAHHPESERWFRDLARPGRLTAGFNVYRANALSAPAAPNVSIPVLGIWSDHDVALTEQQMTLSARFVEGRFRYERIEGASHWFPLEVPELLSQLLLDFFRNR